MFINDVAAGALFIPSVLETFYRTKIKPSKLLIPVAFGSLLGGMATYFTTANMIASDILVTLSPSQEPLSILSFLPTGGVIALAGLMFLTIFGNRLLPNREITSAIGVRHSTGSELEELYKLREQTWEVSILKDSPLVDRTLKDIGLGKNYGLTLVAVHQGKNHLLFPSSDYKINVDDLFLIIGIEEGIKKLADLHVKIKLDGKENTFSRQGLTVIELLVMPRSGAVGKTLKDLDFRRRYGLSVMAVQHNNNIFISDIGSLRLAVGDWLLVAGESELWNILRTNNDFLLMEPNLVDQPVSIKETIICLSLLIGSVILSLIGIPIYLSLLGAVIILLLTGNFLMQEAYEAVEWKVIFIVGCLYSLSIAMVQTGIFGPLGLAGGAFLVSAFLAQIMGGQVSILITGPIAISAAIKYGMNPQAIAVAAAIGCSNSFLTPMAHSINLIMVSPGGYKFKDFFHIGRWLFLISFIGLLVGMAVFWKL